MVCGRGRCTESASCRGGPSCGLHGIGSAGSKAPGDLGTGRTAGAYTTLGTTSASIAGSTPCCGSVRAEGSAPGLTSAHGTTEARSERRRATVAHALHHLLALALARRFGRRMQVDQVPGRGFGLRTSPRIGEDDISYPWARSDPRDPSAGSGVCVHSRRENPRWEGSVRTSRCSNPTPRDGPTRQICRSLRGAAVTLRLGEFAKNSNSPRHRVP